MIKFSAYIHLGSCDVDERIETAISYSNNGRIIFDTYDGRAVEIPLEVLRNIVALVDQGHLSS